MIIMTSGQRKSQSQLFALLTAFLFVLVFSLVGAQTAFAANPNDGCVSVPENPSNSGGTEISICYKWLRPFDKNKRTYIFLVGGPGAGFDYYMRFSEFWLNTALGQKFNLLFFDPRGVGRSSEVNATNLAEHDMRQYTLANMTNDIESLRKALLGDQSIGLIGHSTGGHQVFEYATRFPDHVFKVISLHGGASALGFLTQVYYRLAEWQNAGAAIDSQKLQRLLQLMQSGLACDSDGSKLSSSSSTQVVYFALYGTVSQRNMLPGLLNSLVLGNVDSRIFCEAPQVNTQRQFPSLEANDPLNAMSGINSIINTNVVCSNFITKDAVASLASPFRDPTYNSIWAPQCLPLLSAGKITENLFDVRRRISEIQVPILIVGADRDQWIPYPVQNEIWQNMTDNQKASSEIHELKRCGHFSFYECPSQLKSILDHFIN